MMKTRKSQEHVLIHKDFLSLENQEIAQILNANYPKITILLQKMLVAGDHELKFKYTKGQNQGWKRVGLKETFKFYLWYTHKGSPAITEENENAFRAYFENLSEYFYVVRTIRQHDDHMPLSLDHVENYVLMNYKLFLFGEIDQDQDLKLPSPWTDQQEAFFKNHLKMRVLKGSPGTGKTTSLWEGVIRELQRRNTPIKNILYLTWSDKLKSEAHRFFQEFDELGHIQCMTIKEIFLKVYDKNQKQNQQHLPQNQQILLSNLNSNVEDQYKLYENFYQSIKHLTDHQLKEDILDQSDFYYQLIRSHLIGKDSSVFKGKTELLTILDQYDPNFKKLRHLLKFDDQFYRKYYPDLYLAKQCLEILIQKTENTPSPQDFKKQLADDGLEIDFLVIDEVQDLTPLELDVLLKLSKLFDIRLMIFAGDEAQIIKATDFQWTELNQQLEHYFHVSTNKQLEHFKLTENLRNEDNVEKLLHQLDQFYAYFPKQILPKGIEATEHPDLDLNQPLQHDRFHVYYVEVNEKKQIQEIVDFNLDSSQLLMITMDYRLITKIIKKIDQEQKSTLSESIEGFYPTLFAKGLEYAHVMIFFAQSFYNDLLKLEIAKSQDGYIDRSSMLILKNKLNELRVAISRSTKTLSFIELKGELLELAQLDQNQQHHLLVNQKSFPQFLDAQHIEIEDLLEILKDQNEDEDDGSVQILNHLMSRLNDISKRLQRSSKYAWQKLKKIHLDYQNKSIEKDYDFERNLNLVTLEVIFFLHINATSVQFSDEIKKYTYQAEDFLRLKKGAFFKLVQSYIQLLTHPDSHHQSKAFIAELLQFQILDHHGILAKILKCLDYSNLDLYDMQLRYLKNMKISDLKGDHLYHEYDVISSVFTKHPMLEQAFKNHIHALIDQATDLSSGSIKNKSDLDRLYLMIPKTYPKFDLSNEIDQFYFQSLIKVFKLLKQYASLEKLYLEYGHYEEAVILYRENGLIEDAHRLIQNYLSKPPADLSSDVLGHLANQENLLNHLIQLKSMLVHQSLYSFEIKSVFHELSEDTIKKKKELFSQDDEKENLTERLSLVYQQKQKELQDEMDIKLREISIHLSEIKQKENERNIILEEQVQKWAQAQEELKIKELEINALKTQLEKEISIQKQKNKFMQDVREELIVEDQLPIDPRPAGEIEIRTLEDISFDMVYCPIGSTYIGSVEDVGNSNERPRHKVYFDQGFWISQTTVTQNLWSKVMGWDESVFKGKNMPVNAITWFDALVFCNELSIYEGFNPCYELSHIKKSWNHIEKAYVLFNKNANGYRLPSEVEWEYAAHAGTDFKYAGSNKIQTVGWYKHNFTGKIQFKPSEVKQKQANAWGLYDMSGNVWEWCQDKYKLDAYEDRALKIISPIVWNENFAIRVVRGGSVAQIDEVCRVSNRYGYDPNRKDGYIGFRIVRNAEPFKKDEKVNLDQIFQ